MKKLSTREIAEREGCSLRHARRLRQSDDSRAIELDAGERANIRYRMKLRDVQPLVLAMTKAHIGLVLWLRIEESKLPKELEPLRQQSETLGKLMVEMENLVGLNKDEEDEP